MQQHPLLGIDLLESSDLSPLAKVVVAQHHEHYDGTGYPRGLSGDDIHDHGQIAAIADAYITLSDADNAGTVTNTPFMAYTTILQSRGKSFN